MADLSHLSDEELTRLYNQSAPQQQQNALSSMSDDDLKNAYNSQKGFFEKLSEGQYPVLYNPKSQLFPGPSGKPPEPRGLDLPAFGVGMGEAPGVTLSGAAAPYAAPLAGATGAAGYNALPPAAQSVARYLGTAGTTAGILKTADALDLPPWAKDWAHNIALVLQFGKH